jgi:ribosomal protein S6
VRFGSRFPFKSAHIEFTAFDTLYFFFYRIVNTEGQGVAEFSSTLSVGEAIVRWLNVRDSAPIRARSC